MCVTVSQLVKVPQPLNSLLLAGNSYFIQRPVNPFAELPFWPEFLFSFSPSHTHSRNKCRHRTGETLLLLPVPQANNAGVPFTPTYAPGEKGKHLQPNTIA